MNARIIDSVTTIFAAILCASCGLVEAEEQLNQTLGRFHPVDINEIPRILNVLRDAAQDNYKQIKTWEGEVTSELIYIYEGEPAEKVFRSSTDNVGEPPRAIMNSAETIIKFCLDAEKERIYAHNYADKPIKYIDLDTGRDLGTKGVPAETRAVLTKEYYVKSRADRMRDGVVTRRQAVKENLKGCSGCQTPAVFDPRESFNAGQPVCRMLHHVLEHIEENDEWKVDGHSLKVEEHKNGSVIDHRITIPGKMADGIVFTTMLFSGDKGLNITLFEATNVEGTILQRVTWDYLLVQGIYLPKETTHENYMGENNGLSFSKKMVFEDSQINHSIPAETFTYKNLGLQDGDRFIDRTVDKQYIFRDNELVEVEPQHQ
ncbi:MAG: hypothetical protein JXN61_10855 [Sedimentisphaerales bacterium]|nr:hypothetical protein [Sedimentisphaerales bacterium]